MFKKSQRLYRDNGILQNQDWSLFQGFSNVIIIFGKNKNILKFVHYFFLVSIIISLTNLTKCSKISISSVLIMIQEYIYMEKQVIEICMISFELKISELSSN